MYTNAANYVKEKVLRLLWRAVEWCQGRMPEEVREYYIRENVHMHDSCIALILSGPDPIYTLSNLSLMAIL